LPNSLARGRLSRVAAEFLTIVLGVLVALGVDSWNTERRESSRGEDYLARIAADIATDVAALREVLEGTPSRQESGAELISRLGGGQSDDRSYNALLLSLLDAQHRFELPVSNWTYAEIEGNAELNLIRDPTLRSTIVRYYARAKGYRERLLELREALRTPLYVELANTSFTWGRESTVSPETGSFLLSLPGASSLIHRAMTYEANRETLWEEWLVEAEEVLGVLGP
jgi:hypothetical protein